MEDLIKENVVEEVATEETQVVESTTTNVEPTNNSLVDKALDLLKNAFLNTEKEDNKVLEPTETTDKTSTDEEINKRAMEIAQEKLNEIVPKIKKSEKDELEKQKQEIANAENEKLIQQELEKWVDPQFAKFVRSELENSDVEMTIEEYVKLNKQFAIKTVPTISNSQASVGANNLDDKAIDFLKFRGKI